MDCDYAGESFPFVFPGNCCEGSVERIDCR